MSKLVFTVALFALTACSASGDGDGSGVTRGEAAALNDAAAQLDNNAVTPVPEPANRSVAK